MKEELKKYGKIVGISIFKSTAVFVAGFVFTLLWAIIAYFQNADILGSGPGMTHGNGFGVLLVYGMALFVKNTAAFILVFGAAGFITFYTIYSRKVGVQTLIHQIWKHKAQDYIIPKVEQLTTNVVQKQEKISWLSDKAVLKIQLLNAARQDPETKGLKKRVLNYLFKKSKLNEVDFNQPKEAIPIAVSAQIAAYISELTESSLLWFWIVFIFQITLFIIAQFY